MAIFFIHRVEYNSQTLDKPEKIVSEKRSSLFCLRLRQQIGGKFKTQKTFISKKMSTIIIFTI
jgi:hypothetical protein